MASKYVFSFQGQDYTFVGPVCEDLICPICHELLDQPQQTPCGHLFCKKCLNQTNVTQNGLGLEQGMNFQPQQSVFGGLLATNQGQQSMRMGGLGSNAYLQQDQPSLWTSSSTFSQKQHKCPVCNTTYSQSPTNDKYNERRVKSLHILCKHSSCGWKGSLGHVQEHLDNSCQYHDIPCSMNCGEQMMRQNLQSHVNNDCPLRRVSCRYCKAILKHKMLHDHYQSCKAVLLICPNVCGAGYLLEEIMDKHLEECTEQEIDCTYSIAGCRERMKRKELYKHDYDNKDLHLSLALKRLNLWTQVGENQQLKQSGRDYVNATPFKAVQTMNAPQKGLPTALMARPWLENSKLFPAVPWIIRVDGFSQKMKPSQNHAPLLTQPFYTGIKGYKMQLLIYPRGETKEYFCCLSLKVVLMCGSNDHLLPWPLQCDVSITLLNQLEDTRHLIIKQEADVLDVQIGRVTEHNMVTVCKTVHIRYQDLSHSPKANCLYLKDDCLYLKVMSRGSTKKKTPAPSVMPPFSTLQAFSS